MQASTLLANDSDLDDDPLVITGVSNAVNGTVAFNSQNNVVTFTPTSGYTGPPASPIPSPTGSGGTDTAQVSLSVGSQGVQSVFSPTATPTIVTANDSNDVESRNEVPGGRGRLDHRVPLLQGTAEHRAA